MMRFSLRAQLFVVSLFLLAIPWLGYKYIWELEQYLRAGQEQTLLGTARAVATALHERPALFDSQSAYLQNVRPGTDLYAPPVPSPIRLDGAMDDWQAVQHLARRYADENVVHWFHSAGDRPPVTLAFTHMVGRYKNQLYAQFQVDDDNLVWRAPNSLAVDASDHLLIGLTTADGELQRFVVAPYAAGWVNAYRLTEEPGSYRAGAPATQIQGHWRPTDTGYAIELRFPLAMTSGSLAFALVDVDSPGRSHKQYAVGTANPNQVGELGTVLTPSPEIEQILAGLKYADSRVWVVDRHKRVLARAGDIQRAAGFAGPASPTATDSWWDYIEQRWLLPLYYHILTRPPAEFVDELEDAYALAGQDLSAALTGEAQTLWRLTPDSKAVVLSAAHPIFIQGEVMGAVVTEQTTHGIRTLRNRALEQLFHVILAVLLIATLALVLFARRLSGRVRQLRDATEAVIDDNGKIIGALPARGRLDEIDDLHHTFKDVLSRLQQYNSYLENMAARLSHELRTPVAVVRSSLDMLAQTGEPAQQALFVARAQSGLGRLSGILNSMSEATRLEQAIGDEPKERYNASAVLEGCVEGYRLAYPARQFAFSSTESPCLVTGSADLLAQLLDKLVTNAVEFSQDGDTITIAAQRQGKQLVLTISNPGPLLPEGMASQLMQSMVSVRTQTASSDTPHLGLGLYIANMIASYHKGSLSIANQHAPAGVCVTLRLPLASS